MSRFFIVIKLFYYKWLFPEDTNMEANTAS